ncbi:MAG: hypothetical protein K6A67_11070 [Bacteroidales bacterium]|nr:hypothetical protein [Bacteroidales bacterium]
MKKVFLFAACMMLCASLAFAQTPKKNNNTETATKAVKTEQPAKRAETKAAASKHNCGKCPNATKCDKDNKAKVAANAPAPNTTNNATTECKKACKKACKTTDNAKQ